MAIRCSFWVVLLYFFCPGPAAASPEDGRFGVVFYNVENLFDYRVDSLNPDREFTPDGLRRWNHGRMMDKLRGLQRVILQTGAWNPPALVGLCEVENSRVLQLLLYETGLANLHYRFVHFDSPDSRGMDVALLYRVDRFKVLHAEAIPVEMDEGERPTRDLLYVQGVVDACDTLHVVVAHWPSRYGGTAATHKKREKAAHVTRMLVDQVMAKDMDAPLILMGDFNEPPESPLFSDVLGVGQPGSEVGLLSLADRLPPGSGSLKYRYTWQLFDQVLISAALVQEQTLLQVDLSTVRLFDFDFLLEKDLQYGGLKPLRSYRGMRYQGGFSDHLPVGLELFCRPLNKDVLPQPFEETESGCLGHIE